MHEVLVNCSVKLAQEKNTTQKTQHIMLFLLHAEIDYKTHPDIYLLLTVLVSFKIQNKKNDVIRYRNDVYKAKKLNICFIL